jgi:hypothetical protein
MTITEKPHGTPVAARWAAIVLAAGLAAAGAGEPDARAASGLPTVGDLQAALAAMRPDYADYIGDLRAIEPDPRRGIYMALVQPGATDPRSRGSAPLAGPGARNDIVFDAQAVTDGHTGAFRMLLLDHEYFHARHMAGATSVPIPEAVAPEVQRRFNEAAAWGFNIAEARDGRYPGLREDEFREALDRFRDHYTALRRLLERERPETWRAMADLLRRPDLTTGGSWLSEVRWRPSAAGPATATP